MTNPVKVAIVAALERELRRFIKGWRVVERKHEGRFFKFFEDGMNAVVVCGGIGEQAARRAAEAVAALYQPAILQSVGFAGALDPALKVGDIFSPVRVIDVKDGSSVIAEKGSGVLLTFNSVVSAAQKTKLAEAYAAQAVDMEAAAVARSAQAHNIEFRTTKVISDEFDFEMPDMARFIDSDGKFQSGRFVAFAAIRPWLWAKLIALSSRSNKAATALCQELQRQQHTQSERTVELASAPRV